LAAGIKCNSIKFEATARWAWRIASSFRRLIDWNSINSVAVNDDWSAAAASLRPS
jgi:hypothetical protein